MTNDTAQPAIVPRRAALVPRRTPPPLPSRRPSIHRAWLRALFTPPHPLTYLAPGETAVIAARRHWLVPLREIAGGFVMMAVVSVLAAIMPGLLLLQLALGVGAVTHAGYVMWCIIAWRLERVVVTDSRLIRVHGILNVNVDAVQLSQITDAELRCTVLGRILNYGSIRVETAGQRPVERLDYVPSPGAVYKATLR